MIRILVVLVVLLLVYWLTDWLRKLSFATIKAKAGRLIWWAVGIVSLLLLATGKLNWLFAALGVAIATLARLLPTLLHYAPQFERLWRHFRGSADASQSRQRSAPRSGSLSREEALEILGLREPVGDEDIIQAHRKLIAKLHPDKGGSAYLAAKINLAKQVLLQR